MPLIQLASPRLTANDIDTTVPRCHETEASTCVAVTETEKPPQWMYTLGENKRLTPVMDQDEAITRR